MIEADIAHVQALIMLMKRSRPSNSLPAISVFQSDIEHLEGLVAYAIESERMLSAIRKAILGDDGR